MKHLAVIASMLLLAVTARADWADISVEELLKKTDLVVVARLTDVREFSKGDRDYGSGILIISEVLRGGSTTERSLRIEWSNYRGIVCPRVEHRHHAEEFLIWLLERTTKGTVTANYPKRVMALEEKTSLLGLLRVPQDSNRK